MAGRPPISAAQAVAKKYVLISRLQDAYPGWSEEQLNRLPLEALLKMARRRGFDVSWWRGRR